jgi:hypothetical protein
VTPAVRRVVAAVIAVLATALFFIAARAGIMPMLFGFVMLGGWFFALLVVVNHGFFPRLRGTMLEATTVLGRQSVDLASLVSIRCEIGGRNQDWLRFSDPVNDIAIRQAFFRKTSPFWSELAAAVWAAGHRGIVVPTRVSDILGLPRMPGAPRYGGVSPLLWIAGLLSLLSFLIAAAAVLTA